MKFFGPIVSGTLFSLGLGISGMTEPQNIISFLDISGEWDPTLLFVMIGAVSVYMTLFRFVIKNPRPLFEENFFIPPSQGIDKKFLMGSALFGIGWGLTGLCPGPGLVGLVSGSTYSLVFFTTMLLGMVLSKLGPLKRGL